MIPYIERDGIRYTVQADEAFTGNSDQNARTLLGMMGDPAQLHRVYKRWPDQIYRFTS